MDFAKTTQIPNTTKIATSTETIRSNRKLF